ncbi:hypothetical protein K439DRAFT_1357024 [Ramaria rubella]|nr:hypothetical protein K439DRAFT_1357024 [Ramaria rubella]
MQTGSSHSPPERPSALTRAQATEEHHRCDWGNSSLEVLVNFLVEHKAEAGDGGNFPETVFNQAAQMLVTFYVRGAVKTAKACKQKWAEQYAMVTLIKGASGLPWDDKLGVNLPCNDGVWTTCIAQHPKAKGFSNKGFPLYDTMSLLMPN